MPNRARATTADASTHEAWSTQLGRGSRARARALKPRLLLLDEPFTGRDMPTQELPLELFEELRAGGQALLNRTVIADGTAEELLDPHI